MRKGVGMLVVWLQVMTGSVEAQQVTEWNQGTMRLQNGIELTGELNFNWVVQVVQYRQGTLIKAYSAGQIETLTYFDDKYHTPRKFVSIKGRDKTGHQRQRLLEEMVTGSLGVYREVRYMRDLVRVGHLAGFSTYNELAKDVDNFSYWVMRGDEWIDFPEFYRRIWPQVSILYRPELEQNARRMGWSVNSTIGRLRQISVYNAFAGQSLQKLQPGTSLEPEQLQPGVNRKASVDLQTYPWGLNL